MASFEVNGTLKAKYETQVISDKFQKREFVVVTDTETQYPQFITFQLTQDRCSQLDNYQDGDVMKISFNLRGREWNGPQGIKYFNTLEAWRIEKAQTQSTATPQPTASEAQQPSISNDVIPSNEIVDDLPF
ncbi:MAG: DUF3127 domain-containing protein [Chitinophagaceae bacterium]